MSMNETPVTPSNDAPELSGGIAPLWRVPDAARFLGLSPRWVWRALTKRPEEQGSIPHARIGSSPRFVPEHVRQWVLDGCPPAATFQQWLEAKEKQRKRAS